MNWPAFAKTLVLDDGRINQREAHVLRKAILTDRTVDREEVEFLVDLKKSATVVHADFDAFLFEVLEKYLLRDRTIADSEVLWLRGIVLADGKLSAAEAQLLRQLKTRATSTGPEFDKLLRETGLA